MKWYRFISQGKVQHVYYRKSVAQAMMQAGYNGYVRNLDDGTVEIVVFIVDEESDLPKVLQILKEGSPMSKVEKVTHTTTDDVEIETDGFEIRY